MIRSNATTAPDEFVVFALRAFGDDVAVLVETLLESGLTTPEAVDVLREDRLLRIEIEAIDAAYRVDAGRLVAQVEDFLAAPPTSGPLD